MNTAKIGEAYDTVKISHNFFVISGVFDIVTCGECVAGIQTYPGAVRHIDEFKQTCQMFKRVTYIGSLPCGIFKNCDDIGDFFESVTDGFGNKFQAVIFGKDFQMASGVEIQKFDTEQIADFNISKYLAEWSISLLMKSAQGEEYQISMTISTITGEARVLIENARIAMLYIGSVGERKEEKKHDILKQVEESPTSTAQIEQEAAAEN